MIFVLYSLHGDMEGGTQTRTKEAKVLASKVILGILIFLKYCIPLYFNFNTLSEANVPY